VPALRIDGSSLDYESRGDARHPTLLLLHALGSSLAMWDAQVRALAAHFRIVRLSLRGHGASSFAGPSELTIDTMAGDACALLDALAIERAHWCGLSLGGMVAMCAAQLQPGRVDRLVLANTTAHMPPADAWSQRIALVREQGMTPLAEATMQRWFTPAFHRREPDEVERIRRIFLGTDPSGYAAACTAIRDMDQRTRLQDIHAPTLVIAGSGDASMPPERAAELQAAIPGAQLVVLEAAHLSNMEACDDFNAAVLRHLDVSS